jgi:hypothetical protein
MKETLFLVGYKFPLSLLIEYGKRKGWDVGDTSSLQTIKFDVIMKNVKELKESFTKDSNLAINLYIASDSSVNDCFIVFNEADNLVITSCDFSRSEIVSAPLKSDFAPIIKKIFIELLNGDLSSVIKLFKNSIVIYLSEDGKTFERSSQTTPSSSQLVQPVQPLVQPPVQPVQPLVQPVQPLVQPLVQPPVHPVQPPVQPNVQPVRHTAQPSGNMRKSEMFF